MVSGASCTKQGIVQPQMLHDAARYQILYCVDLSELMEHTVAQAYYCCCCLLWYAHIVIWLLHITDVTPLGLRVELLDQYLVQRSVIALLPLMLLALCHTLAILGFHHFLRKRNRLTARSSLRCRRYHPVRYWHRELLDIRTCTYSYCWCRNHNHLRSYSSR